jgi:rRNA maturation RNase YbeY
MKTRIDIEGLNERTKQFEEPVKKVLDNILQTNSIDDENLFLSVFIEFVDDEYIRQINFEQRDIDSVTDVLSFPATNSLDGKIVYNKYDIDYENNELFLGDILICERKVFSQAESYGHSPTRECVFLASHGLLHLLGYDHQEEKQEHLMQQIQESILKELGYDR